MYSCVIGWMVSSTTTFKTSADAAERTHIINTKANIRRTITPNVTSNLTDRKPDRMAVLLLHRRINSLNYIFTLISASGREILEGFPRCSSPNGADPSPADWFHR